LIWVFGKRKHYDNEEEEELEKKQNKRFIYLFVRIWTDD